MTSLKRFTKYLAFVLFIIISFSVHYFIGLHLDLDEKALRLIKFGYIFNFILTGILLFAVSIISKLAPVQTGYAFLAFSVVKIGIILMSFKFFKVNLEESGILNFFLPFFICLFFEVFLLVKILNSPNFNNTK